MSRVTTFCGLFELKTGAIVSGELGLMGGLISFVGMVVSEKRSSGAEHFFQTIYGETMTIAMLLSIILFSAMLIYGAVKRNKEFVSLWMMSTIFSIIFFIVLCITTAVALISGGKAGAAVLLLLVCAAVIAFVMYMWVVVYSFYHELHQQR